MIPNSKIAGFTSKQYFNSSFLGKELVLLIIVAMELTARFFSETTFLITLFGPSFSYSLGRESDNIAKSLFAGEGFGNPFGGSTGATAWMAPAYPALLYLLYVITDFQPDHVILIVRVLTVFSLWFSICSSVNLLDGRMRKVTYLFSLIFLGFHYRDFFLNSGDSWLILLALSILLRFTIRLQVNAKNALNWGVVGGFCALCNPVIGGCWVGITVTFALIRMNSPEIVKYIIIASVIFVLVLAPWGIRNKAIFDEWIPIKSNLAFEWWQSLVVDDDGILDQHTLSKHPWAQMSIERSLYSELGEKRYLSEKRSSAAAFLKSNPELAIKKALNRFFAACVIYEAPLNGAILKIVLCSLWCLPIVSVLICIVSRSIDETHLYFAVAYFSFLAPYILISYYARYSAPLFVVKAVLVGCLIHRLYLARP